MKKALFIFQVQLKVVLVKKHKESCVIHKYWLCTFQFNLKMHSGLQMYKQTHKMYSLNRMLLDSAIFAPNVFTFIESFNKALFFFKKNTLHF